MLHAPQQLAAELTAAQQHESSRQP
jgi:hypothetical protein